MIIGSSPSFRVRPLSGLRQGSESRTASPPHHALPLFHYLIRIRKIPSLTTFWTDVYCIRSRRRTRITELFIVVFPLFSFAMSEWIIIKERCARAKYMFIFMHGGHHGRILSQLSYERNNKFWKLDKELALNNTTKSKFNDPPPQSQIQIT